MFEYHQRPLDKNGWDRWDAIKWEGRDACKDKEEGQEAPIDQGTIKKPGGGRDNAIHER